jgi:hypothetical protein
MEHALTIKEENLTQVKKLEETRENEKEMLKKIMKLALTLQKDTLAQCLRTGQSGYS